MTSRRPAREDQPLASLPDLPEIAYRNAREPEDVGYRSSSWREDESATVRRPTRTRFVSGTTSPATADSRAMGARRRQSPDTMVLPPARQVVKQAIPNLAVAAALFLAGRYHEFLSPSGVPLWAVLALAPGLVMLMLADAPTNPLWRRAAMVNLITIGAMLPILSIRRYLVRLPYVDGIHGTVLAPALASVAAVVALVALGIATAIVSREDPEYAGVLILPACLLVPACSGATQGLALEGSLYIGGFVFLASAAATVVASLLPGAFPALVAPAALAAEFVFLTLVRQVPLFPAEVARPISVLFLVLILTAVMLTVMVPILSVWCGRVRLEIRQLDYARSSAESAPRTP